MNANNANKNIMPKTETQHKIAGIYFEGIGRRKTAVARVRVYKTHAAPSVNGKPLDKIFAMPRLRTTILAPLADLKISDKVGITASVSGGGINAQAEAIRHGLSRALILMDPEYKKRLRTLGFLTRDPRMVERKKYGLKKARRAPQWAKR